MSPKLRAREQCLAARASTIQALYSVPELATMSGLSRWQVSRMLATHGVEYTRIGVDRFVPISELRRCLPQVWDSIVLRLSLMGHDVG